MCYFSMEFAKETRRKINAKEIGRGMPATNTDHSSRVPLPHQLLVLPVARPFCSKQVVHMRLLPRSRHVRCVARTLKCSGRAWTPALGTCRHTRNGIQPAKHRHRHQPASQFFFFGIRFIFSTGFLFLKWWQGNSCYH
jgi:hypothetical protein